MRVIEHIFAIDLSMRSTGLTYLEDGVLKAFELVDDKESKDEELILNNANAVCNFISSSLAGRDIHYTIALEGIAFGAMSGSKDILYGNFWGVRCELHRRNFLTDGHLKVIPVTSWRSPLFNKEERASLKLAAAQFKELKKPLTGLKGEARVMTQTYNKRLERAASVKQATFLKLPDDVRARFETYILESGRDHDQVYDLTDSYFLGRFVANAK